MSGRYTKEYSGRGTLEDLELTVDGKDYNISLDLSFGYTEYGITFNHSGPIGEDTTPDEADYSDDEIEIEDIHFFDEHGQEYRVSNEESDKVCQAAEKKFAKEIKEFASENMEVIG